MATKKKVAEPVVEPVAPAKAAKPKAVKPANVDLLDPETSMTAFDSKAARTALGINQSQFWQQVFVTQSGGSRYENDRSVPRSIQALLVIAYGTDAEAKAMFDHLRAPAKEVVEV